MTSPVDTSVKHFYSATAGAPTLNGTAGSLITLLDATLVTGFGIKAVDSATVSNGVCRLNFSSGVSTATQEAVIMVAGASPAALNGEQKVTAAASSWVEFKTDLPDGAVTGSVSFKMAPLGWEKVFSATNVAVYRSASVEGTRMYLRVDDSGTTNARVRAFETMTDVATGVGAIPLDSQVTGGLYWPKSDVASAVVRTWCMAGDARGFYLAVSPSVAERYTLLYSGDIASLKSGDAYGYLLTGNEADESSGSSVPLGCVGYSHRSARGGAYLARSYIGIGQSLAVQRHGVHHNGATGNVYAGLAGYSFGAYPNGPNNGLMTGSVGLYEFGIRGYIPGLLHPVQDCSDGFATTALVDGTDDLAGRKLMAVRTGPPTAGLVGTVFIDTTGPWSR